MMVVSRTDIQSSWGFLSSDCIALAILDTLGTVAIQHSFGAYDNNSLRIWGYDNESACKERFDIGIALVYKLDGFGPALSVLLIAALPDLKYLGFSLLQIDVLILVQRPQCVLDTLLLFEEHISPFRMFLVFLAHLSQERHQHIMQNKLILLFSWHTQLLHNLNAMYPSRVFTTETILRFYTRFFTPFPIFVSFYWLCLPRNMYWLLYWDYFFGFKLM